MTVFNAIIPIFFNRPRKTIMSRIAQTFQSLQNRKALIPYITAGDPTRWRTAK